MILSFLKKDQEKIAAEALYVKIVEFARSPYFYSHAGVSDDVEGRFEILALHIYLVLRRLKQEGETAKAFSQKLFDTFFKNMDHSLRELGVGDLSVGRRIRNMAEGFYGRVGAYDDALDNHAPQTLANAFARNIFGVPCEDVRDFTDRIALYSLKAEKTLQERSLAQIKAGEFGFDTDPLVHPLAQSAAKPGELDT